MRGCFLRFISLETVTLGDSRFSPPGPSPYAARDLVRRLLCVDPKRRLTAAEALLHPWISSPGATPAGGAGAAASSPEQLKFKVSPRRPTVRGLDKVRRLCRRC
jgi:serine/threonine protein kinase